MVMLSYELPFPLCATNDSPPSGQTATPSSPDLTWPDSPGAGCPGAGCACNAGPEDGGAFIPGFQPGGDLNLPSQLAAQIDQLVALQADQGLQGVALDTVLLWNDSEYALLGGPERDDLFQNLPSPYQDEADGQSVATRLFLQLAQHGQGSFQEVDPPSALSLRTVSGAP